MSDLIAASFAQHLKSIMRRDAVIGIVTQEQVKQAICQALPLFGDPHPEVVQQLNDASLEVMGALAKPDGRLDPYWEQQL